PYTYNVCVPVTTVQKQMRSFVQMVPEQVTTMQTVSRTVRECVVDPCTGCQKTVCRVVCEQVPCTRTVMRAVCTAREVDVPVTTFTTRTVNGMRTVCEAVPSVQEVVVNVTRCQPVERKGVRTVCEAVPSTEEVMVNVTRCQAVERKGVRTVC